MIQPSHFWIFLKEMETVDQRVLCTSMFVTALFTVAKTCKQPKCLSMDEWIKKRCVQWKILKEMGTPDHLTCLLRNLFAGQEATVRNGHGTTDWFQIGKGGWKGCILSPWLFYLYAEYIMWNARLDKSQAEIKICQEKYQQPQICRWHHSNGRK